MSFSAVNISVFPTCLEDNWVLTLWKSRILISKPFKYGFIPLSKGRKTSQQKNNYIYPLENSIMTYGPGWRAPRVRKPTQHAMTWRLFLFMFVHNPALPVWHCIQLRLDPEWHQPSLYFIRLSQLTLLSPWSSLVQGTWFCGTHILWDLK